MGKKEYKTDGIEWLSHSMAAYNGTGYADKTSAQTFLDGYLDYCGWKKRAKGIILIQEHPDEAMELAERLVEARPAGREPSRIQRNKFDKYLHRARSKRNQHSLFS